MSIHTRWGIVPDELAAAMLGPLSVDEIVRTPAGTPNTPHYGSIPIHWESKASLRSFETRWRAFRQMQRTSMPVTLGILSKEALLKQAAAVIRGENEQARALLAEQWGLEEFEGTGRCEQSYPEVLRLQSAAIDDGCSFLAPEWVEEDGRFWIKRFHVRHLDTLRNIYEDATGRLVGISQAVYTGYGRAADSAVVPLNQLLYTVYRPDKGGHLGLGILRTAHPYWVDEQVGFGLQKMGKRRYAVPTPVARDTLDPDSEVGRRILEDDPGRTTANASMDSMLRGIISDVNGFMRPAYGFEVDTLKSGFDPEKMDRSNAALSRIIADCWGAGFLLQGQSDTGSFSMVKVFESFQQKMGASWAEVCFDAMNAQITRQLFEFNLPQLGLRDRASMWFTGLPKSSLTPEQQVAAKEGGLIIWDPKSDQEDFRAEHNMGPAPSISADIDPMDANGLSATASARRVRRRDATAAFTAAREQAQESEQ